MVSSSLQSLFTHLLLPHSLFPPESEISDVDSDAPLDETLFDRIAALQDIIPPTYRKRLGGAASTGYSWAAAGASFAGKSMWVLSTSVLLLGVPWALAFSEEQQVQEMEREMRMQQNAQGVSSTVSWSLATTASLTRETDAYTGRGCRCGEARVVSPGRSYGCDICCTIDLLRAHLQQRASVLSSLQAVQPTLFKRTDNRAHTNYPESGLQKKT